MPKTQKRKASDDDSVVESANIESLKPKMKAKVSSDSPREDITHWLMKSEPESRFEKGVDVKVSADLVQKGSQFGIEDLKACTKQTACWDGVRNYQARNFMKDHMRTGHKVFFYHSNTKEPGIAGLCRVVKESYVDHTQFDPKDPHYDPKATKDNPRWYMVDVQYERMMKKYIPLSQLKALHQEHKGSGGPLRNLALFTKARLSVQPITTEEWDFIMSLENQ